ncbi:MAG: phosphatase PAP2 family protein, partial [Pseudobdellovibrionaceae bacterium]|nr:phosphatase PAP2 family protein [Pseudobdellovibrionaceae bacterium]
CNQFLEGHWPTWKKVSYEYTHLAEAKYYFAFTLGLLFLWGLENSFRHFGFPTWDRALWRFHLYRWSAQFFKVLLLAGIAVHVLKFIIGRKRPYVSNDGGWVLCDPSVFLPFEWDYRFHSLPSGHSQLIFTVATFLSYSLPHRFQWIKVVLFSIALFLALTRVGTADHFLSDVLAGGFLGVFVTWWLLRKRGQQQKGRFEDGKPPNEAVPSRTVHGG